jgi:NADPH2:quinone reductase
VLAAVYRTPGPASEVLSVEDLPRPEPGAGEVRVRLRLSGVNPTDWRQRVTTAPQDFQIPGQDGAGVIDAVGEGVPPARVGQRVWVWFAAARGRRYGTAAQWTVVPSRQAVALPEGVSDETAAGLGIPAMTAWCCLFAEGDIAGRTVLVAGGGGAVGNAAVALAADAGATVVSTARSEGKRDLAQQAGAAVVVDPVRPEAVEQVRRAAPAGVDLVLEVALGANLGLDRAVLRQGGTVTTYATDRVPDLPVRDLMVLNATLRFFLIYGADDGLLDRAAAAVTDAAGRGLLGRLPVVRHPLQTVGQAHDAVEAGAPGKVLLEVP